MKIIDDRSLFLEQAPKKGKIMDNNLKNEISERENGIATIVGTVSNLNIDFDGIENLPLQEDILAHYTELFKTFMEDKVPAAMDAYVLNLSSHPEINKRTYLTILREYIHYSAESN